MKKLTIALLLVAGLTGRAMAHPSTKVVRNEASCTKLAGSDRSGERGSCIECVRKSKHHFHPELSGDKRCHLEDAKP